MKLTKNARKALPIGIDIGTTSVKLAQVRSADQQLELSAAALVPVPNRCQDDPAELRRFIPDALRAALSEDSFDGRECIISLPARDTFVRHVKLPKLPPAEIPRALVLEFQGKLPYDVKDAVIRHVVAGEIYDDGEQKQELIVVTVHRPTLESYVSAARKARLNVVAVNIEAFAVVECFGRLFNRVSDEARTTLFLDFGARSTQVVLAHGKRAVFAHNLKRGASQFDVALAERANLPVDLAHRLRLGLTDRQNAADISQEEIYHMLAGELDVLADELTQCLRYYESVFRNRNIERAIFVGGQAYDRKLCQLVAQRLNLPAQIGDPLLRLRCPDGVGRSVGLQHNEPCPALAVAVGLSLGGASHAA